VVEGAEGERVRVKMRVGEVEVEVEWSVGEVGGVVDKVLAAVAARGGVISSGVNGGVGTARGGVGRGETCKGLIVGLWGEGWFGVGRSLGEVHGELGRRGFHYDRTAVAHALVDLVREGVLTRVGRARRYRYLQKRPPPSAAGVKKAVEEE
jgi:hypothetical protein